MYCKQIFQWGKLKSFMCYGSIELQTDYKLALASAETVFNLTKHSRDRFATNPKPT